VFHYHIGGCTGDVEKQLKFSFTQIMIKFPLVTRVTLGENLRGESSSGGPV